MAKQRISYVPLEKMDERMRKEMERCQREGTPRPESSAVRAHVPAAFWFFADSWNNLYRNGVADHALKELARNYDCSVVLCTATQPALEEVSDPERRGFRGGFRAPRELAPDVPALFAALRRVTVRDIGIQADKALAARIAAVPQAA